ncbi:hypothetical protein [Saccharopolyspora erythraea]|uniref:hypothetical protein n=1 Tax=Saccharopolyspora erythraea TaxID=1836 RepID=UPI002012AC04|nr:hypothetical protein [Saccharopolyspora erythraea]
MTGKADFTGIRWWTVEWTMLCTLYLRACESRSPHSILGDRAADEAVRRIDYNFARMRWVVQPSANQYLVALRARQLDLWAADFLARHQDAVVLHLGVRVGARGRRTPGRRVPRAAGGKSFGRQRHRRRAPGHPRREGA